MSNIYKHAELNAGHPEQQREPSNIKLAIRDTTRTP